VGTNDGLFTFQKGEKGKEKTVAVGEVLEDQNRKVFKIGRKLKRSCGLRSKTNRYQGIPAICGPSGFWKKLTSN